MQYFLRYLFFVLSLFSCAPTISEEVVEVSVGNFFYDVRSDEVIIEGSISASNLFSIEGSKVSIDNIEVNDYGHYIFVEIDNTDPSEAEFSTINPGPSQQNFLSVIPGLNPDVQYYARVYAVPENSGAPLLSDPEPFVVSNANNVKRVNFWDTNATSFPDVNRNGTISFGIGNLAFIGTGFATGQFGGKNNYKDLYQYSAVDNSWSEVNSVPVEFKGRFQAVSFTVGNSAYIGMGMQSLGTTTSPEQRVLLNDLWEYNQRDDAWELMADYLGTGTVGLSAAVVNDKVYVGMGTVVSENGATNTPTNEFYEYDPVNNVWTEKASFPFDTRSGAIAFGIEDKVYYGTGAKRIDGPFVGDGFNYLNDFYEYDPSTDNWTRLNDLPITLRRSAAGSFSVGGKGYMIAGGRDRLSFQYFNDFYEYDPNSDSWDQIDDFPGQAFLNPSIAILTNEVMIGYGDNWQDLYFYVPFNSEF